MASLYTYESGARMVNFLITLGMPMVGIEPRRGSVGTWLNVYSGNDSTQTLGGFSPRNFWSSRAVTVVTNWLGGGYWGALSLVSSFIPVGRAGRTNRCAINIGIDTIGGAAVGHGDLTSGAVWNSMLGWLSRAGYGANGTIPRNATVGYCPVPIPGDPMPDANQSVLAQP